VAWILVCKRCELSEEICYNSRDIEFFLGDYFFGPPCTIDRQFDNIDNFKLLTEQNSRHVELRRYHITFKFKEVMLHVMAGILFAIVFPRNF